MTALERAAESWTERFFEVLPAEIRQWRAEALWRTLAPNKLDLLIGETVADLGGVRAMLSSTTPDEWLAVAELIENLMERAPLNTGSRYTGERIILGALAAELRSYVGAVERSHEA